MKKNPALSKSIQDKHTEVHYDQKVIHTANGLISIKLQGKVACPLINQKITPMVCAKLMETSGWPRDIDPHVCEGKLGCYVHQSIKKNMNRGKNGGKTKKA